MPQDKPNVYSSRRVVIPQNQRVKVLDYTIATISNWQAWIFSNNESNKSTALEFELLSTFGAQGTLEITIGGGAQGGGLVTGTGACEVYATGNGNNDISVWFVDEQRTISLEPKSQEFEINTSPGYFTFGYPPFGRNKCSVMSTGQFTVQLLSESGTAIFNTVVNTSAEKEFFANGFFHPSNAQLQVLNNSANQKVIISHFK